MNSMRDVNGWTPLMWSCHNFSGITPEVIDYAIDEYESDSSNDQSTDDFNEYPIGTTAAMISARQNNIEAIALLLGHEVDFQEMKDVNGNSAYDGANRDTKKLIKRTMVEDGYGFLSPMNPEEIREYLDQYRQQRHSIAEDPS